MWESRRDFQGLREEWEAGFLAFHAFLNPSFPQSVFYSWTYVSLLLFWIVCQNGWDSVPPVSKAPRDQQEDSQRVGRCRCDARPRESTAVVVHPQPGPVRGSGVLAGEVRRQVL